MKEEYITTITYISIVALFGISFVLFIANQSHIQERDLCKEALQSNEIKIDAIKTENTDLYEALTTCREQRDNALNGWGRSINLTTKCLNLIN